MPDIRISGRRAVALKPTEAEACSPGFLASLRSLGVDLGDVKNLAALANSPTGMAMDAADDVAGWIDASADVPSQFLRVMLPGIVGTATTPTKADEFLGRSTIGTWIDREYVRSAMMPTAKTGLYGDLTQIPYSDYALKYEVRNFVTFESGFHIGVQEAAQAARVPGVNPEMFKRAAQMRALNILRDDIAHFGFNTGGLKIYGLTNEPGLPGYVTVAGTTTTDRKWENKDYTAIINDFMAGYAALVLQSDGVIDPKTDPITVLIPPGRAPYLSRVTAVGGLSVADWLRTNYPQTRIMTAPKLAGANAGADVMYMYVERIRAEDDGSTDGGEVWTQAVPATYAAIGVERASKGFSETGVMCTGGALLNRPYGVVRFSGI